MVSNLFRNSLASLALILAIAPMVTANEMLQADRRHHHNNANTNTNRVAVKDMQRHCQGEASAKFGERPQDILTLPVERDHGMYTVYGQYPPSGSKVTLFICTFNAQGELVGVDKQ